MNWKVIEAMARSLAAEPDKPATQKQFYLNVGEVSVLLGKNRKTTARFLAEHSVPFVCIGNSKSYFLADVIDAVEKTRFIDRETRGRKEKVG